MAIKVQKWGNSLGVRIPKNIVEKVKLSENCEVEVESKNGAIVIVPVVKEYVLDDLLEQITKDNLHSEEAFKADGDEVW